MYDVIVVGARAAGAATAMLAARAGLRVLVIDRGRYGSDTLSTHALMRGAVLQLRRWGLLSAIRAAGTPAIRRATFHYRDSRAEVEIAPSYGVDALYAPRRTVLDPILVDAAADAGAETRFGATVHDVVRDADGTVIGVTGLDRLGHRFTEWGRWVVGADGVRSVVAERVRAPITRRATSTSAFVYGHWEGIDTDGYDWVFRSSATAGVIPTNDGLTTVFAGSAGMPGIGVADFESLLRKASPEVAGRVLAGRRVGNLRLFAGLPGYIRRPWGRGWALVGDAGYWKDPLTAHGLTDALRDAELLARALVAALVNGDDLAMERYELTRDGLSARLFAVADTLASMRWSDGEIGGLLRELSASATAEVEFLAGLEPIELVGVDWHAMRC